MIPDSYVQRAIKSGDVARLTRIAQAYLELGLTYSRLRMAADDVATTLMTEGLRSLAENPEARHRVAERLTTMLHRVVQAEGSDTENATPER